MNQNNGPDVGLRLFRDYGVELRLYIYIFLASEQMDFFIQLM